VPAQAGFGDVRVQPQRARDRLAQDALADAVDHAHLVQSRQHRAVESLVEAAQGLLLVEPAHVDRDARFGLGHVRARGLDGLRLRGARGRREQLVGAALDPPRPALERHAALVIRSLDHRRRDAEIPHVDGRPADELRRSVPRRRRVRQAIAVTPQRPGPGFHFLDALAALLLAFRFRSRIP